MVFFSAQTFVITNGWKEERNGSGVDFTKEQQKYINKYYLHRNEVSRILGALKYNGEYDENTPYTIWATDTNNKLIDLQIEAVTKGLRDFRKNYVGVVVDKSYIKAVAESKPEEIEDDFVIYPPEDYADGKLIQWQYNRVYWDEIKVK